MKSFAELNVGGASPEQTLAQLLKKQEVSYLALLDAVGEQRPEDHEVCQAVEIEIKYEGYISRQLQQIRRFKKLEEKRIPSAFDYDSVRGFSAEVLEKLKKFRPHSIGQASRISGITPAAISLLLVALEKYSRGESQATTCA